MLIECVLLISTLCHAVKDKPVRNLAIGQGIAEVADGVTTRRNINKGYVEAEPIAKLLLGSRPSYKRMIPTGILENLGTMWLAEKMRQSNNWFVRSLFWVPQTTFITGHGAGFAINLRR